MGYEIRLTATTKRELSKLRRLIRAVRLKPGKPFAKVNRSIQPIYGRQAMERFIAMLSKFGDNDSQLIAATWLNTRAKIPDKSGKGAR